MARNYRKYTEQDIRRISSEVKSMAQLLEAVGLRIAGGNYNNMRKTLQRFNIDCSHWTGQAWNKDKQLKDWSNYNKLSSMKPHLIKDRGHKCEKCKLEKWFEELIPLEIEHQDGDRTNNKPENLVLLCCNCHALTPTWRGRKNKKPI